MASERGGGGETASELLVFFSPFSFLFLVDDTTVALGSLSAGGGFRFALEPEDAVGVNFGRFAGFSGTASSSP